MDEYAATHQRLVKAYLAKNTGESFQEAFFATVREAWELAPGLSAMEEMRAALRSIEDYGSIALANYTTPSHPQWFVDALREMRDRARQPLGSAGNEPNPCGVPTDHKRLTLVDRGER